MVYVISGHVESRPDQNQLCMRWACNCERKHGTRRTHRSRSQTKIVCFFFFARRWAAAVSRGEPRLSDKQKRHSNQLTSGKKQQTAKSTKQNLKTTSSTDDNNRAWHSQLTVATPRFAYFVHYLAKQSMPQFTHACKIWQYKHEVRRRWKKTAQPLE